MQQHMISKYGRLIISSKKAVVPFYTKAGGRCHLFMQVERGEPTMRNLN